MHPFSSCSLSKWSNYPKSIREKNQTSWTIQFYLDTWGTFLRYFMIIEFFFWNFILHLAVFCFDKSTKLNIAKFFQKDTSEKKFCVSEKIWLSPPSIQKELDSSRVFFSRILFGYRISPNNVCGKYFFLTFKPLKILYSFCIKFSLI